MADPYKNAAACYDRLFEKFNKGLWKIGLSLYPPQPNMRVLDVGCGTDSGFPCFARNAGKYPPPRCQRDKIPVERKRPTGDGRLSPRTAAGSEGLGHQTPHLLVELAAGITHFRNHLNFLSNKGLAEILSENDLAVEKIKIVSGGNLAVVLSRSVDRTIR